MRIDHLIIPRLTCRCTPMRTLYALILVLATWLAVPLRAEDLAFFEKNLGRAPNGFSWYLCHGGFLAIRRPDGWFVKEDGPSPQGTMACFVTKEKIAEGGGKFGTGFSINILPKFAERRGEQPSQYAKRFIASLSQKITASGGRADVPFEFGNGPIKGIGLRYVDLGSGGAESKQQSTTIHQLLVANDQTSTLYISAFESPTSEWDTAWKFGEVIVQRLGILSNK